MYGSTLVLLSGGIDSCATLALYRRRLGEVSALFVDYGQVAAGHELPAARRLARHYGVDLSVVICKGAGTFGAGYIRARNALLLQIGLATATFEVGQVAIGLHAGTTYPDCTPGFVTEMQRVFDLYCAGRMRVAAPFIDDDKRAVVAFCREQSVPIDLTYSCERGELPPCGECLSCRDRMALDVI